MDPFRPPAASDEDPVGRLADFDSYNREHTLQLVAIGVAGLAAIGLGTLAGLSCSMSAAGGAAGATGGLLFVACLFWSTHRRAVRLGRHGIVVEGNWLPWNDVFYLQMHAYGSSGLGPQSAAAHYVVYIGYSSNGVPRFTALGEYTKPHQATWLHAAATRIRAQLTEAEQAAVKDFAPTPL